MPDPGAAGLALPAGLAAGEYGQELTVGLISYLRAEIRFPGLDALRAQIAADAAQARAVLGG